MFVSLFRSIPGVREKNQRVKSLPCSSREK